MKKHSTRAQKGQLCTIFEVACNIIFAAF